MMETMSVVSVPIKLPKREVHTLSLHPFTSLLSQLAAPDDVTGGLLPVKCDAPLSDTLLLESSVVLSTVQTLRSLPHFLLLWLHRLMYLPAFLGFLYVFLCLWFLTPTPSSDLRILSFLGNSLTL